MQSESLDVTRRRVDSSKKRQAIFLNLTNGLEFLNDFPEVDGFVRIQSTACEQKRWWPLILDLDYTFLFAVGLGRQVLICDASAKKQVPRAIYQGVEWIRYVLNRSWLDVEIEPVVRGHFCRDYFCWNFFDGGFEVEREQALHKLDYVKKLCNPTKVDISALSRQTLLDGKYDEFQKILIASACNG